MTSGDAPLLVFAIVGTLMWVLGRGMRDVKPNPWYGVRLPTTFRDERVWRDANRQAAREFERFGWTYALAALLLIPLPDGLAIAGAVGLLTLGVTVLALRAVLYTRSRVRHYERIDEALRQTERGGRA